jgi:hypothetical protein
MDEARAQKRTASATSSGVPGRAMGIGSTSFSRLWRRHVEGHRGIDEAQHHHVGGDAVAGHLRGREDGTRRPQAGGLRILDPCPSTIPAPS